MEGKIAVRYAVEAIVCGRIETKSRRRGMAIDRKAGACKGCASERALIHAGSRIGKAGAVTADHQIGRAHVELQSLMRISYAVFCLKKKNTCQVLQHSDKIRSKHWSENVFHYI